MSNAIRLPTIVLDDFSSAIDIGNSLFSDSNAAFYIKSITWENPTTQDHTAVVKDGAGNTIFSKTCQTARDSYTDEIEGWRRGITIDASGVGSGTIIIRCR